LTASKILVLDAEQFVFERGASAVRYTRVGS
jgi:hypothetical protein